MIMADVENLDTSPGAATRSSRTNSNNTSSSPGRGPSSLGSQFPRSSRSRDKRASSGTLTELNLRTMLYALPAPSRRRDLGGVGSAMELVENFEAVTRPASIDQSGRFAAYKGPVIETDVLRPSAARGRSTH